MDPVVYKLRYSVIKIPLVSIDTENYKYIHSKLRLNFFVRLQLESQVLENERKL